ncbi:MAG: aldehyde dehydrogenase family protein [Bdellovibrionales bacterium]|nr:aldehyde dehydrogenase family protein [Bdellovibrionales bacterium]
MKYENIKDVKLESINPADGSKLATYTALDSKELHSKITASSLAWEKWKLKSFKYKEELLDEVSSHLIKNKEGLSELITKEMGKPLNQSVKEIEKCALLCRYYKEHGVHFLSPREEFLHYKKSYVYYAPMGACLGIMPWNFPFWQIFRFAIPALFAGNAVFVKPSENVIGSTLALEKIFHESGWPSSIFNVLLIKRSQVESVISHPFIKMVSFTGSTKTGQHIASLCGYHLKKHVLELGGSDPYIVLKDANIQKATKEIISSRLNNSGQSCIATKRVIVEKSLYKDLIQNLMKELNFKNIFHPLYNPDVGPLAKKEFVEKLIKLRDKDVEKGAEILFEKKAKPEEHEKGFYFPITLMGHCRADMECAKQELFGPLLPVFQVEDESKALEMANQTSFGLGAAIFTQNEHLAERWARHHINSGSCYINGKLKSNPSLPFGGINKSGYGRELSVEGIREFTNIKTIVIH